MSEIPDFFSVLEGVHSQIIGFYFPIPILLFFFFWNRKKGVSLFLLAIVAYPICLVSGIGVDAVLDIGDRMSAITSGIFSPLLLAIVGTLLLRKHKKIEEKTISEHLVD